MPAPAEVVASGVRYGEGPVWRAATQDLLVASLMDGLVHRVDPRTGRTSVLADTTGGPNGLVGCCDGGVLVAQNGGVFDFGSLVDRFPDAPAPRPTTPGIQRVTKHGAVTSLTSRLGPFRAPNDLVVAADGSLYFTDPPSYPLPPGRVGRVIRMSPRTPGSLSTEVVADGLVYPNGIALTAGGDLVVVEETGLLVMTAGAEPDWLVRDLGEGGGDGIAVDQAGYVYVCSTNAACVRVVDPDGDVVEALFGPGPGFFTNCCFGGSDLRTLFVVDAENHRLLAFEGMPTRGAALHEWTVSID